MRKLAALRMRISLEREAEWEQEDRAQDDE